MANSLHLDDYYAYSPRKRSWDDMPSGNIYRRMLDADKETYAHWIQKFAQFNPLLSAIPFSVPGNSDDAPEPCWDNIWFPPLDGICLYGLLATLNPATYLEVGSGYSTKFARRAINDNGLRTQIISIDPQPRAAIDALCDKTLRSRLEDLDLQLFTQLAAGDVVFIDNSHRSFQNSDVTVFFTEILPLLPQGVVWGIHDILLPDDYPAEWANRYYNEQYLLMAFLLGGAGDNSTEIPVRYIAQHPELLEPLARNTPHPWQSKSLYDGGGFWMRKGGKKL